MALQITRSCILAFTYVMNGAIVFFYCFICEHFKSKEILHPPGKIFLKQLKNSKKAQLFVKGGKKKKKSLNSQLQFYFYEISA